MTSLTLHHIGVAVPHIGDGISTYERIFGYRKFSGPFDDPIQRATVCFLGTDVAGGPMIELIAPFGKDSPVAGILAKGAGAYHLCYEVDDLDRALRDFPAGGCVIISRPAPAVAFDGRLIAWLYTPTRQLTEVVGR